MTSTNSDDTLFQIRSKLPILQEGNDKGVTFPRILTPHALLSRDPQHVATTLSMPLDGVFSMRSNIADAIIMDNGIGHGIDASRRISTLDKFSLNHKREIVDTNSATHFVGCVILSPKGSNKSKKKKAEPLIENIGTYRDKTKIIGSITALDVCLHSSLDSFSCSEMNNLWSSPLHVQFLQTGSIQLDNLIASSNYKLGNSGPLCKTMADPLQADARKCKKRKNHNLDLDNELLGLSPGTITEVSGATGSGKTQIALSLAIHTLLIRSSYHPSWSSFVSNSKSHETTICSTRSLPLWNVHYIAGGGGCVSLFSLARRLRQIFSAKLSAMSEKNAKLFTVPDNITNDNANKNLQEFEEIMDRIKFTAVSDGYSLLAALHHIELELTGDSDSYDSTTNKQILKTNILIILDSVSGCLASNMYGDGDGGAGAATTNEVGLVLRRLSRWADFSSTYAQRCSVFVTNGTVSTTSFNSNSDENRINVNNATGKNIDQSKKRKAALGGTWRAADVRLSLDIINDEFVSDDTRNLKTSSVRWVQATLEKHYAKSCHVNALKDKPIVFGIASSGLIDIKQ